MGQDKPELEDDALAAALALGLGDMSPENRRNLSSPSLRAYINLGSQWRLSREDQARTLGVTATEYVQWAQAAASRHELELPVGVLARISAVLGIYGALRTIFVDPERGYGWLTAPNAAFDGQVAIDLLLGGRFEDLMRVRRYLDAEVHG